MNEWMRFAVGGTRWLTDHPVFILLLLSLPFFLLGWLRHVYPRPRLALAAFVPCCFSLMILWNRSLWPIVLAVDMALLVIAIIDQWRIPGPRTFHVQRQCQPIASLRQRHPVELLVANEGHATVQLEVRDGLPSELQPSLETFTVALPARSRATLHYDIRAARRGAFEIDAVHLRVQSRLGLWSRNLRYPLVSEVKVYPDLKQLRDYTLDDNYRHIDWRSTARRNRLTVKDFQTNQSQRVMFMLDCGRMMTNISSGISLLDHALNAALMLSYVALSQGDSVGLVTFSDRIHSSIPLRSGKSQMNHLLHAVYDRFPTLVESRYEDAFLHLSGRCRKRSLVVLITNIIDEVNARQIHRYLSLFSQRHLPLAVILRDHQLYAAVNPAPGTPSNLYRRAAAAEILSWRHQAITDLQHQGVLVLDTFPEDATAPLINEYLEAKARHRL